LVAAAADGPLVAAATGAQHGAQRGHEQSGFALLAGFFFLKTSLTDSTSTVFLAATKSRTLELLAFDEYCRFDTSAFF
jgi:hypothetical protein